MPDIWFITGGGRSGKSAYAENLAAEKSAAPGPVGAGKAGNTTACQYPGVLYIATASCADEEMRERIARHRADRPKGWITWERHRGLADIEAEFDAGAFGTILLDCLGNLLMGILFEEIPDAEDFQLDAFGRVERLSISEIDTLRAYARKHEKRLIFVTNEIGMGIIPATRYSRYYRDALGRVNKHAAAVSDRAVLMVAGIPMTLK
ncbi:MAG: bifunctional adenosylcobinamide kinase/adenosylcobinamide-phosphate guanylyltransferase [Clostridiales Family XIII bacterium]|jgi:adenosylcobinamide kinase/adenosylcobinamide-phosphate guanylyltransferase|nr:bifunctional adenosylcobinamide kinase/adenosylcobinamide-phosphate guanylyltransferase [Clostridiales Family XIII bacterium]